MATDGFYGLLSTTARIVADAIAQAAGWERDGPELQCREEEYV
jgi:hypothetical protein